MRLFKFDAETRINLELVGFVRIEEGGDITGKPAGWMVVVEDDNQHCLWCGRFESKGIAEGFADNIMLAANKGRNEL